MNPIVPLKMHRLTLKFKRRGQSKVSKATLTLTLAFELDLEG